jgi:hypothetical protein
MRSFVRGSSLSLFFGLLFLVSLVGQAFAGRGDLNEQRLADGLATMSLGEYVMSSHYAVDVAENWQSEFLQFLLFIMLTVWLVQVGSPESKRPDKTGRESDEDQKLGAHLQADSPAWAKAGGWRTTVFSRSLGLVMSAIFLACWGTQAVAGWVVHNEERMARLQDPLGFGAYLTAPDFWGRSLQNWQSEFLAVGTMAVLSIYLRERGSPESKPVGASHRSTGVEG